VCVRTLRRRERIKKGRIGEEERGKEKKEEEGMD
jgi:hypothetical protein